MRKFYIADTHFGKLMKDRPFETVDEMDRTIIHNWNSAVDPEDEVYIVGDVIYKSKNKPEYYLDQLKGRKHLILGNHDKWSKQVELNKYFISVSQIKEITDQNKHIILCHYPMLEWPRSYYGSLHIFGHIHAITGNATYMFYKSQQSMLNAGVDINHYIPVTLHQLIQNNAAFKEHN